MPLSDPIASIYPRYDPFPPIDTSKATFQTHLNYIRRIALMTKDLVIDIPKIDTAHLDPAQCAKFEKLAAMTIRNIHAERDACLDESAYALIAAPWMSAKCYYALYYLETVFLYWLEGSPVGFRNGGHLGVRKAMTRNLKSGKIVLAGCEHADDLAIVSTWEAATGFKTTGSTISQYYYNEPDCSGSVRKKLAEYIEVDWKRGRGIKSYRATKAKELKLTELHPKEFSLLDYFYWMRIKTHYRDLDFLDFESTIGESEALTYTICYVNAMDRYAKALHAGIQRLRQGRSISGDGLPIFGGATVLA